MYGNLPVFNKHLNGLVNSMVKHVDNDLCDLRLCVNEATCNMILETTLGTHVEPNDRAAYSEYLMRYINLYYYQYHFKHNEPYLFSVQECAATRMFQPWFRSDFIWSLTRFPAIVKEFADLQLSILNKVISISGHLSYSLYKSVNKRLKLSLISLQLLKQKQHSEDDKLSIIDHLLKVAEDNEDFTLTDVKDESNTVMMAVSAHQLALISSACALYAIRFFSQGADTTSLTIATTLLMLAIYPEHQQKVYEEIQSIVPGAADEVTREQVEKLDYTEMCIKESLRIFPMVAYIGRQTDADVRLKSVDCVLPKGTSIAVGVYSIHHNKQYWGDTVEEFVPDRFLPENEAKMHPYSYLPFSGGSRNCVGK